MYQESGFQTVNKSASDCHERRYRRHRLPIFRLDTYRAVPITLGVLPCHAVLEHNDGVPCSAMRVSRRRAWRANMSRPEGDLEPASSQACSLRVALAGSKPNKSFDARRQHDLNSSRASIHSLHANHFHARPTSSGYPGSAGSSSAYPLPSRRPSGSLRSSAWLP